MFINSLSCEYWENVSFSTVYGVYFLDFEIVIPTILDILSSKVMKSSIYFEYTLRKGELFSFYFECLSII